jgi:hypothetical protein
LAWLSVVVEFLDGVGHAAKIFHRQACKWERRRQREERLARRLQEETDRRRELMEQATALQQVTKLREMIAELRRRCAEQPVAWNLDDVQRWITWAEALMNRSDPFLNGYFDRVLKAKRVYR